MTGNRRGGGRKKPKDAAHGGAAFAGGALGAHMASVEAAVTDAMTSRMKNFLRRAEQWRKLTPDKRKGYLYEDIEIAYRNADSAFIDGKPAARLTREGTEVADAVVGEKLYQFKTGKTARHTANNIKAHLRKHSGKRGMDKVTYGVPKDQAAEVREILGPRVKVEGGRASMRELNEADVNPRRYAARREIGALAKEALAGGTQAAAIGGVIGGAMSAIRNLPAYFNDDIDGKRAAKNIAVDSIRSGAQGGATAVLVSAMRYRALKAPGSALAKLNTVTAVADLVVDAGATVLALARGKISSDEAAKRLGETTCSSMSGLYAGAAAGAILGPPGAVVGSIAGYMLASSVYQSCIAIFHEARLAEEEAERIVVLCREAARALDEQRELLEARLDACLDERRAVFDDCFRAMDAARANERPDDAIASLSLLVATCGRELQLATFEEFDEFMTKSDDPIVL